MKVKTNTTNISTQMTNDGYEKATDWWVGWRYLNAQFNIFDDDTIITIRKDNIDEQHPLANQLAEEIWDMFISYHTQIEELESIKSVGLAAPI